MQSIQKAFTLIELLIVVAIIAILAAIAVPNFLEAQTRAKVSRMMSDMRTTATGLESYRVDNNNYPPWADWYTTDAPGFDYIDVNSGNYHARVPNFITTPIAYMSSLSRDVFVKEPYWGNARYPQSTGISMRFQYFPYAPIARRHPATAFWGRASEVTGGYLFYSMGPDQHLNDAAPKQGANGTWTRYDPTNGTISWGNIVRTAASPVGAIPGHPNLTGLTSGPN